MLKVCADWGAKLLGWCDELAALTEQPGTVTRTYLTPRHRDANAVVGRWMAEAGMRVRTDAVGNLVGRWGQGEKTLVIGSHLDTVRDAGRYDGILGVLIGIACVAELNARDAKLPFAVEVYGFGDEEGVRFAATLIGSRALAGTLDPKLLEARDAEGTSLAEALSGFGLDSAAVDQAARAPSEVLAYLEAHIEQGPVLETEGLPVGVVSAICGATRKRYRLAGQAGHAGTVPMGARRDALAGAAEAVLAVEAVARRHGIVGTVGRIAVNPDAVNVIPGAANFTLDLRAEDDALRVQALAEVDAAIEEIAGRRGLGLSSEIFHEGKASPCDPGLRSHLAEAIVSTGLPVRSLPSGAGHDAMAVADLCPTAMLFIRCRGGISHNPAESVEAPDVTIAVEVMLKTIEALAGR